MSQNPYGSYGNNQPEEPQNPYQSDPQSFNEAQKNASEQTQGSYAAPQNSASQPSNYQGQQPNYSQGYQQNPSSAHKQPNYSQPDYNQQPYASQNNTYAGNSAYAGNTYGGAAEVCVPRPHVGVGGAFSRWSKNLFHFSGRASRSEFWWVYGLVAVALSILSTIFGVIMFNILYKMGSAQTAYEQSAQTAENLNKLNEYNGQLAGQLIIWSLVLGFIALVSTILLLSVWWRRLQDAGYPGALVLLSFVGLSIVPFILAFFPSSSKGCKYDKPADANRP